MAGSPRSRGPLLRPPLPLTLPSLQGKEIRSLALRLGVTDIVFLWVVKLDTYLKMHQILSSVGLIHYQGTSAL